MSNTIKQSDGRFLSGLFFRVLPAQIFLLVFIGINSMIDGLVGANFLGAEAMSTIGLYTPFQLIWVAVGNVLVVSSQVLCARYMGSGDLERTRAVFSLDITLTVVLSVLATLLSFFMSVPIARIFGASPGTLGDLSGYIISRGIGLVPMVLGSQFVAFLSLEGQDKRNFAATGAMLAANVVLDLFFVAVIKMGISGLGVATSLSQWISMIVAGSFFLTRKASLKYSFKGIRWNESWEMFKIGMPSAMVFFLTSIQGGIFNNLLAKYDPTMIAVAAMSTYAVTVRIFESVGKGVAAAGRLLTSVCYGEEDGHSMTSVMKTVFTKGLLITVGTSAIMFLFANPIAGMFYSDPSSEVFKLTVIALRFGAMALIFDMIAAVFSNYFQAIGRTFIVNLMSVLEGIAATLPIGLLLIPKMGVLGCAITYLAGNAIVALCGPVYAIIYWKRVPETLSEWVTIPADFGAADDERFDASIHSLEDAVSIAEEVQNFCRGRGIDEKKAYCSALALEELCLGIIKDRFGADRKKHTIEVRVVDKGEDVFMSIKDDCRPYNPKDREEFLNPQDDSPKSISIRLFMGIVKETEYQQTLGINVFTVTV